MKKRLIALLTALAMLLSLSAALAESAETDPVLVTVNGVEIRESDPALQFWYGYLLTQAAPENEEQEWMVRQYAMDYTIYYLVTSQKMDELGMGLTAEEAAASRETAKAEWDEIVDEIMAEEIGVGPDASEEEKTAGRADTVALIQANYGYTEESYIAEASMYNQVDLVLGRALEYASRGQEVTDEAVEEYFNDVVQEDRQMLESLATEGFETTGETMTEEQMEMAIVEGYEFYTAYFGYNFMYKPEGYRAVTHILLPVDPEVLNRWVDLSARLEEQNETTEPTDGSAPEAGEGEPEEPVTPEMVEEARLAVVASVQDTLDQINAELEAGATFDEMILKYGIDEGMKNDAQRSAGYEVHKYSLMYDANFTRAAMSLEKVGDISEPVVSQLGVHILYYLRDVPGGAVELTDSLREEIRANLAEESANAALGEMQEQWISESEIVWTEAGEPWKMQTPAPAGEE